MPVKFYNGENIIKEALGNNKEYINILPSLSLWSLYDIVFVLCLFLFALYAIRTLGGALFAVFGKFMIVLVCFVAYFWYMMSQCDIGIDVDKNTKSIKMILISEDKYDDTCSNFVYQINSSFFVKNFYYLYQNLSFANFVSLFTNIYYLFKYY